MMSKRTIAKMLSHMEGKKIQVRMGDIMELLTKLEQLQGKMQFEKSVSDCPLWKLQDGADKITAKIKAKYLRNK